MIVLLLALVDFLALLAVLFSPLLSSVFLAFVGFLLFLKGTLFVWSLDIASFLDMTCGLFLVAFALGFSVVLIKVLIVIYLAQKLLVSFF